MEQERKLQRRPGASTAIDPVRAPEETTPGRIQQHVARGIRGPGAALPHLSTIQRSFGAHDVSGVQAHGDGNAVDAAGAIGADAYAAGEHVAFGRSPDLHLAAEEAAHVVQQRAGIKLAGNVGAADDEYEEHAHAVADAVVAGESAEPILDLMTQRDAAKGPGTPVEGELQTQMRRARGAPPAKADPWTLMFKGAANHRVHRAGRIQAEKGVRLRKSPSPGAATIEIAPFNTEAMVERETTEARENDRWAYVVTKHGAGFCERQYVTTDMPECSAKLYLIKKGDTLGGIAERVYGSHIHGGNDARLYVHALYLANKHRTGIVLEDVDLSGMETALRGESEEETLRVYKGVQVLEGMAIWLPSNEFIQQLKKRHQVTSGSTEITKAWRDAKEAVGDAIDDVKYAAGVVAGLVEGAGEAVYDMFKGAAEMAVAVSKIVVKLLTGDFSGLLGMAKDWIGDLAKMWKDKGRIKDGFIAKWTQDDAWSRGRFHGEVIGWVAMTVLLIVLTAGQGTGPVVAVLATKFPTLVKALQAVGKIGDVTTYTAALAKGAHRIGDEAEDVIQARINAARRRPGDRDGDGKPDKKPARKPERGDRDRGDRDEDRDDNRDRGSEEALRILRKIRRSTKIAKFKLEQYGASAENFVLVQANYQFIKAAGERAQDENLDAFVLTEADSAGDCRRVVVMPHAMPALKNQAHRAGSKANALEAFASGDREQARVRGAIDGRTFEVHLEPVYNGPH